MQDTAGHIHFVASLINFILCGVLAVYFGRFSCFYELQPFDPYASDTSAGIFSVAGVLGFLVPVITFAIPATRYSSTCRIVTQTLQIVFGLLVALFGISVFSIVMLAGAPDAGETEVSAAQRLMIPDRAVGDISWTSSTAGVCEIQRRLGCMMWTEKNCVMMPSRGGSDNDTATGNHTTTTSAASPQTQTRCVTCGLETEKNVTENATTTALPTCFQAVLTCFRDGDIRSAKTSHVHDLNLLIVLSLLVLLLTVLSVIKNATRSLKEYRGFGALEHGLGENDYGTLGAQASLRQY